MRWFLLTLLLLAGCGGSPRVGGTAGAGTDLECVPFARQLSGIQLYGDAADWWEQAAGQYDRTHTPEPGAVLVFRRSGRLAHGHVSVVSRVLSDREITVTQANWVHRRITRDEAVQDVSDRNDWSAVRVWWAPTGALGASVYATFGFVISRGHRSF